MAHESYAGHFVASVSLLFKSGNIAFVKASYADAVAFISAIYLKSLALFDHKNGFLFMVKPTRSSTGVPLFDR